MDVRESKRKNEQGGGTLTTDTLRLDIVPSALNLEIGCEYVAEEDLSTLRTVTSMRDQ
jgi:hypothetical protein